MSVHVGVKHPDEAIVDYRDGERLHVYQDGRDGKFHCPRPWCDFEARGKNSFLVSFPSIRNTANLEGPADSSCRSTPRDVKPRQRVLTTRPPLLLRESSTSHLLPPRFSKPANAPKPHPTKIRGSRLRSTEGSVRRSRQSVVLRVTVVATRGTSPTLRQPFVTTPTPPSVLLPCRTICQVTTKGKSLL